MATLQVIITSSLCALFLAAIVVFTGCESDDESPGTMTPTLNLQTLEAETEFGTLEAERADNSYVGQLGEGQAIGIVFLRDITIGNQGSEQLIVYLYHREELAVLTGEVDSDGVGTLESGEPSDFEATVELEMDDEVVSGTATFSGEQATPFTAKAASGIAGVYWAEGTNENPDVTADWVVLPDERQWGCVCAPPRSINPCCQLRTF